MAWKCFERQVTTQPHGHILTNAAVWSPDGKWIIYDVRSDSAGSRFDGQRIERVHVETGEVQILYEARHGAYVGAATYSPTDERVVFIHGPEHPTADWSYSATRRQGVIIDGSQRGPLHNLDARDLTPPFTPGALRGGSHVHQFDAAGEWLSFTYDDYILEQRGSTATEGDINQRNVGVCAPVQPVRVNTNHPRNHDGSHFAVLVTRTTAYPRPGSDDITNAREESWVGREGYLRPDGVHQRRALAFQGDLMTAAGQPITEVFIVDIPQDVRVPGDGPLEGTPTLRPAPPHGTRQRRLTYTAERKFPGLHGPRHWLRSSPDGLQIAFLMKDDNGIVQLWAVSPLGGSPTQLSHQGSNIASAFTWRPDGRFIAYIADRSVFITQIATGTSFRLTGRAHDNAPRAEACVYSPDGSRIAFVKPVRCPSGVYNQVFVVDAICQR